MSEYRLIMTGVIALCALAVVCSINPSLAQVVSTVFVVLAVAGGVGLLAVLGWFVHLATTDAPDDDLEQLPAAELPPPHWVRLLPLLPPPAQQHRASTPTRAGDRS